MFLGLIFSLSVAQAATLTLSQNALDGDSANQISHIGNGEFDSYLAMNLPFAPEQKLKSQIEKTFSIKLKQRGEAHVTVITPVEFWQVLKPAGVTMKEIDEIASAQNIQATTLKALCVGRGNAKLGNKTASTFYVVVEALDLIKLRKKVQNRFEELGGKKGAFKAEWFYPHITVGFTDRDLHEADGVIKNIDSCVAELKML